MKTRTFTIGSYKTTVIFDEGESCLDIGTGSALYVFDSHTSALFPFHSRYPHVILPPGESSKTWNSIDTVCTSALHAGLARDDFFIGVGGGVVCDLTGLSASLFMRGTGLLFVPTTLLAMSDAALGGKTGFDYGGYKNILGTFYPASEIRICPQVLSSLPEKEFKSGLAEVIKHALLRDRELFSLLIDEKDAVCRRDPSVLAEIIDRSLMVKGFYVEEDFFERGIRTHLNFGHTFGHALEAVTGFETVSHGEAVMWGIEMALTAGILLGETDKGWKEEVDRIFSLYNFRRNYHAGISADDIISAMTFDKKKKKGKVRFVLQHTQGDTFTASVPPPVLHEVLTTIS